MSPRESVVDLLRKEIEGCTTALAMIRRKDAQLRNIPALQPGAQEFILEKRNRMIRALEWAERQSDE